MKNAVCFTVKPKRTNVRPANAFTSGAAEEVRIAGFAQHQRTRRLITARRKQTG